MESVLQQRPKISVCIPTYCGSATIAAAIECVLAQSFTDFELIVVDDGSRDETQAIVESFEDSRLCYLRNERNLGPQESWNRCLSLAQGKYFKLLPHDDLLHPLCLERQVAVLDADHNETLALVFSARDVIGPNGQLLLRRCYPGGREGSIAGNDVMRACVRRGTNLLGEPGAVLFRKSLADRVGLFDATNPYVIDLDYWFRLLVHGDAYFCLDSLASFRVSPQSWSVAIGDGQSSDFRKFVSRVTLRGGVSATRFDYFCGRFTPALNNFGRLVFYRLFLK